MVLLLALLVLLTAAWSCGTVTELPSSSSALLADAANAVQHAKTLQPSDPLAAIEAASAAATILGKGRPRARQGKTPSARALLWAQAQIQLGTAYHTTIRHDEAAAAYGHALSVLEAAPRGTRDSDGRPLEMEILAVKMERGWALSKGRRHSEALAETAALRKYAPAGKADRAHFEGTLQLEESRLLWCDGQDAAATLALERGLRLYNVGDIGPLDDNWSSPPHVAQEVSVKMNELLQLYRWQGRELEAEKTARAAMRLVGWPSTTQRPLHTHDHSLSARGSPHANRPWLSPNLEHRHDTSTGSQVDEYELMLGLDNFITELEAMTDVFRVEYEALAAITNEGNRSKTRMMPQSECLHQPGNRLAGTQSGDMHEKSVRPIGDWLYFPCKGDGGGGCSHRDTPQACSLLPALAKQYGVELVRFGYSELEAGGWIRPHVGPSNAQLKIHLGLKVPQPRRDEGAAQAARDTGVPAEPHSVVQEHCPATFTIAGQTRRWVAGRALLFDDSYEHSVRNGCDESRTVLQLVIAHPAAAVPSVHRSL